MARPRCKETARGGGVSAAAEPGASRGIRGPPLRLRGRGGQPGGRERCAAARSAGGPGGSGGGSRLTSGSPPKPTEGPGDREGGGGVTAAGGGIRLSSSAAGGAVPHWLRLPSLGLRLPEGPAPVGPEQHRLSRAARTDARPGLLCGRRDPAREGWGPRRKRKRGGGGRGVPSSLDPPLYQTAAAGSGCGRFRRGRESKGGARTPGSPPRAPRDRMAPPPPPPRPPAGRPARRRRVGLRRAAGRWPGCAAGTRQPPSRQAGALRSLPPLFLPGSARPRRPAVHEPGAPAAPPSSLPSLRPSVWRPFVRPWLCGRGRRGRRSPGAGCAPSGGGTMSRRKQATPNKVHWEHIFAGLEEHTRQAMMKRDFPELLADQSLAMPQLPEKDSSSSDSEGYEETGQDEDSSPASEADGTMATRVKEELEPAEQHGHSKRGSPSSKVGLSASPDALMGLSRCPLCQLECGSREQLVTHVYQHTAAAVVSAKSYLCPVCGRALSSPGSLGRHLLIHSEDQLSNCAVCGARFTSHATFNSEKVPEVLCGDALPVSLPSQGSSGAEDDQAAALASPVYPAGILLVCNSCVAYRKLLEAQAPSVRKWALRRQNEPLEVRLQRLERERTAKKSRRDNETPEEREVRRMRDREAKRLQRMQETDEQRARRLQRDREAMRLKRANETPEKRQARLIREREAKRLKRRLEKMDMMLRAQFGQDPSAMAALAAEMSFFPLPVGSMEIEGQLLGKMAFEEPSPSTPL